MSKRPRDIRRSWLRELTLTVLAFAARLLIMLIGRLMRFREIDCAGVFERVLKRNEKVIFAFWHNRLCFLIYYMAWRFVWRGRGLSVIVSASWDGELAARVGRRFGADVVRGSTSRMAISGLVGMLRRGLDGATESSLVVTPDGPRGPRYYVQSGVIFLAQKTGLPIVPVTYGVNRGKRLRSWDGFLIPVPGARAIVLYGAPVTVPPDADDEARESVRQQLQSEMIALVERAEAMARGTSKASSFKLRVR